MLKASALYMAIIIALIIAIFSASLIATAYFYRLEVQKKQRYTKLLTNLDSGIAILLSENYNPVSTEQGLDLYGEGTDSLKLGMEEWGLFNIATVKSYTLNDTLKKAFLIGEDNVQDSSVLYLSDEDRPLSVSGNTQIIGDAILPKAGIKQAYVESRPYSGTKLVYGAIKTSQQKLPALSANRLKKLEQLLDDTTGIANRLPDSVSNSFFNQALVIRLPKTNSEINTVIQGKVIIISDTTITLSATASVKDILVFAPDIIINEGFTGTCQLFARNSIVAGKKAVFHYPSSMGLIKPEESKLQAKISLGNTSQFSGILFTYEANRSDLQTMISLGKDSKVKGEIFATGYIKMQKPVTVDGKVSCNRFIIQTPTTLYENYLIDINLNRKQRSKYYLSSSLFNSPKAINKVLKWLN